MSGLHQLVNIAIHAVRISKIFLTFQRKKTRVERADGVTQGRF